MQLLQMCLLGDMAGLPNAERDTHVTAAVVVATVYDARSEV